jgi:hypothetical protein
MDWQIILAGGILLVFFIGLIWALVVTIRREDWGLSFGVLGVLACLVLAWACKTLGEHFAK